jgi:ferrochelatase
MKRAVVLFNLGGPDAPSAVEPFLFNLFNDPAIIGAPGPIRWALAKFISARRAPKAQAIYAELGGASPLLANTRRQADALGATLGGDWRVFIAMRYWHPMADETARAVAAWGADKIVLMPLYPQYSTTTSGSSLADWHRAARRAGLAVETSTVCCYPTHPALIAAQAKLVRPLLMEAAEAGKPRLLLSAHGLPKKVVAQGDPYQWQVEATARALVDALGIAGLDWQVCYQSRVGPLAWIGPYAEAEIARAGRDKVPLVVAPIAFVSEHSETLVELDRTYRDLALGAGVPRYRRVPALAEHPDFIDCLATLAREAAGRQGIGCAQGARRCPKDRARCALAA